MTKHFLIAVLFIVFGSSMAFSQETFDLPPDIVLKEKEDYTKYANTFIEAAKWLEETDLDKEPEK